MRRLPAAKPIRASKDQLLIIAECTEIPLPEVAAIYRGQRGEGRVRELTALAAEQLEFPLPPRVLGRAR